MNIRQTSETVELAIFLAISGGFMDAYSYICRGNVFANAQTGNMLLFGVHISQGQYSIALKYLYPVLCFAIGIMLSDIIKNKLQDRKLHWRQIVILIEIAIFCIVSVIPLTHNLLANNLTSFACGMQVEAFRKFHGNGVATTMCIGNLRSATEHLYSFFNTKKKISLFKSLLYYFVIFCFVTGAIIGNIFIKMLSIHSILICNITLAVAFFMMIKEERKTILNL